MMSTIGDIEKSGFNYIASLQAAVKKLWLAMCKEDDIDPAGMFIVFSDDNTFRPFYDRALSMLQEARAAHVPGGGYVGLKITGGKAVTI